MSERPLLVGSSNLTWVDSMRLLIVLLVFISANVHSEEAVFDIQIDHVTLLVSDV